MESAFLPRVSNAEADWILQRLRRLCADAEIAPSHADPTLAAIAVHALPTEPTAHEQAKQPLDAEQVTAEARQLCLRLATILPFVEGVYQRDHFDHVVGLADKLGINDDLAKDLQLAAKHHLTRLSFDILRRDAFARTQESVWRFAREIIADDWGLSADRSTATRYEELQHLDTGTVGRAFWLHYSRNGFPMPGKRHGLPERFIVPHDLVHVLFSYSTSMPGELLVTAAQAGFQQIDPTTAVLFGLFQWQLGHAMDRGVASGRGHFEPDSYFTAIQRGARLDVDLFQGWDWWPVMELSLEEARGALGIEPVARSIPAVAEEEALVRGELIEDPTPAESNRVSRS